MTPPSSPRLRRFLIGALAAIVAGCSVKLPSPPDVASEADQRCVIECQAQHIRCLQNLGSGRSAQKRCAGYLGSCYEDSCKKASQSTPSRAEE